MKKTILRLLCALIVCILMITSLASCGASTKTLMKLGEQEITLNVYELLLSRMKGKLSYNGYPTGDETFWDQIISAQGATYDDYFCHTIQDQAKRMLAELYLFEEVYHLTLPKKYYDEIDQFIADAIDYNFGGSETDFNTYLQNFGVNKDMLRENYIMEDKIDYLMEYISGITSDAAREEYYAENYVCFRQILLPLYEYKYETDENGDLIYYHSGENKICYDTVSGKTKKGTDGKNVVDDNGDTVYYTEDGRIAYDTKKGVKMAMDEDNDGYADYEALDEQAQAQVKEKAEQLGALIEAGDFAAFEEHGNALSEDDVWNAYPNGIYISLNKTYEVNYIDDIQTAMTDMKVGDTALVLSENAYHLIMKYEAAPQGYAVEENADWFGTFEDELVSSILDSMCEQYIEQIVVDEDVLEGAATMKNVGTNMEY